MGIKRIGKHLFEHHWRARRIVPPEALALIEQATQADEATHSGQLRFAVARNVVSATLCFDPAGQVTANTREFRDRSTGLASR
jgi:hypothetical protein